MPSATLEITIVLILLVANGLFAMTEIAIVSSRKAFLQSMADQGNKGAARALTPATSGPVKRGLPATTSACSPCPEKW